MAEKEYIEREAAIAMIRENGVRGSGWSNQEREDDVVDMIESIPAADVRRVVLCRNCKYAQMTIDGLCKYCDRLTEIGVDDAVYLSGDFFCSYGEKREES